MSYIFIYVDHNWHFYVCKLMISVRNLSILSDFGHVFDQNVQRPFQWQRLCKWMKESLITWFWVPNTQDRKVSAKSVTMRATALCKNLSGYRELLLSCYIHRCFDGLHNAVWYHLDYIRVLQMYCPIMFFFQLTFYKRIHVYV